VQICWMKPGYEMLGWKKTGVVEWRRKAPTVVREAAVEQRSKVGREDDQSFHGSRASRVDSLPIQLFLGSSLHVKAKGREDASGFQLGEEDSAYAILRAQSRIRFGLSLMFACWSQIEHLRESFKIAGLSHFWVG
jgi:hypothetical protein